MIAECAELGLLEEDDDVEQPVTVRILLVTTHFLISASNPFNLPLFRPLSTLNSQTATNVRKGKQASKPRDQMLSIRA